MTAKMKAIIAKVNKRDYIKEKDSAHQMPIKKKKTSSEKGAGETIFEIYIQNKMLIFKIYTEFLQLNSKKCNKLIKK